jgi:hypothetical protein
VILFSLVCPVWMVGAFSRRFDHLSVHRAGVLLGTPLFVYFDFRVLSFF